MTPQLRTMRILWFAMLLSTFLYLIPAYLVVHPPAATTPILLPVLGFLSLVIAGMSAVWTKVMLKTGLRSAGLELKELANINAERMFRDQPMKSRVFADPKLAMKSAWPRYHVAFILGMALAESIALFGLVLIFLGFPWTAAVGFFAVCWALMLYHFPQESRVRAALESAYDASLDDTPG